MSAITPVILRNQFGQAYKTRLTPITLPKGNFIDYVRGGFKNIFSGTGTGTLKAGAKVGAGLAGGAIGLYALGQSALSVAPDLTDPANILSQKGIGFILVIAVIFIILIITISGRK